MNPLGAQSVPIPLVADDTVVSVSVSELQLAQLQQQLDAARAELQDFVYTVSHDLRAPLRHITAFAQVIAEDSVDMPPDIAEHLVTIRLAAQLLTQQLDGLAAFSRLGQHAVQLTAVDTGLLLREVVEELSPRRGDRLLQWHLAPDLPQVLADAALLRQVFARVLDNALKFTRNCERAEVAVSWQALAGGGCQISVQDNGIGFHSQQAGKLFKVFGRLRPVREYEGLGLGLLQCRKLLERMGASITISAQADVGCVVNLTLPLAL